MANNTNTNTNNTATANNTTATTVQQLPNKGKLNWGALKGKANFAYITQFNELRKASILLREKQEQEKFELLAKFPGHYEKGNTKGDKLVYKTNDPKKQTKANELLDALAKKHREASKKDREQYDAIYKALFPEAFYDTYVVFAKGETNKSRFREACYKFITGGLQLSGFGKKGLDEFTDRVCDAIGVKLTADAKFVKTDDDIEPYTEASFNKLVLGVVRQFCIEKNVIKRDAMRPDEDDAEMQAAIEEALASSTATTDNIDTNAATVIESELSVAELLMQMAVAQATAQATEAKAVEKPKASRTKKEKATATATK